MVTLYHVTGPEAGVEIMRHGFQEDDVHHYGYGVCLYNMRPSPDGTAWLKSRKTDVHNDGVEVSPGPMLCMGWHPPENYRWLRVSLAIPPALLADYRLTEYEPPAGQTDEEHQQWLEALRRGEDVPTGEPVDWGYEEYHVPLDLLLRYGAIEGPFRFDEELDDPVIENTAEAGIDFTIEIQPDGEDE